MADLQWPRILLKLSGEAFAGGRDGGLDPATVITMAEEIAKLARSGVEVAVVVGGGNFFRGEELQHEGLERATADTMGMLGTVTNALALQGFLENCGVDTRMQSAIKIEEIAEPYIRRRAIRHLEKGRVVVFGAGIGVSHFSTDTAAIQRALDIEANAVLMAKHGVDGIYSADPRSDPTAIKYDSVTYDEVIVEQLKVADATCITLARDNRLPIVVFDFAEPGIMHRIAVSGHKIGTLVG